MPSARFPRQYHPVMVFVHGGAWQRGDKAWGFNLYGNVGVAAARAGAAAVVCNYRLAPAVQAAEQVNDLLHVMRWVTRHIHQYGGDARRTLWAGHSAGAHLVASLAARPRAALDAAHIPPPAALLLLSAVLNVERLGASSVGKALVHPAFGHDPAAWRAASPAASCHPTAALRSAPLWLVNAAEDFHLHDDAVELAAALAPADGDGDGHRSAALQLQAAVATRLAADAPAAAAALHTDGSGTPGITTVTVAGSNHATVVTNIGAAEDATTALLTAIIATLAARPAHPPAAHAAHAAHPASRVTP